MKKPKIRSLPQRLAVCSWSLQPENPNDLIKKLNATGIRRVQLALDPLRNSPGAWGRAAELLRQDKIEIVSGMFGCAGEDYSTLETIRLTGGIAPDATWQSNWETIRATAALAHELGLKLVTFHAGFLPHDEKKPNFAKMVKRLQEAADAFKEAKIALGLETGQETAPDLARLLEKLNRRNVGVNFDPANMILYGTGDPITALETLAAHVITVHCKDGNWPPGNVPGALGQEQPLGQGSVGMERFIAKLKEIGYQGPLSIEREEADPVQRRRDILMGVDLLRRLAA